MDFTKDAFKNIFDHLPKFTLLLMPGMIIMDFAMQKGLFSGGINNIYDFIFLVVWSIMFSFPYYLIAILIVVWNQIKNKSDAEEFENNPSAFETVSFFIFILVALHYFVFKMMLYFNYLAWVPYFGFDKRFVVCIVSMLITFIIGLPFSKLFYYLLFDVIANTLGKHLIKDLRKDKK